MQCRMVLCTIPFLLVLASAAQADPITLNVTSWLYGSSLTDSSTLLSINAVDSNGKAISIGYINNFSSVQTSGSYSAFVIGLPYTSATTTIVAGSGIVSSVNGSVNFSVTTASPISPTGVGTVFLPAGLTGTITASGQTLSFSLPLGIAFVTYNATAALMSINILGQDSIIGQGGTVKIDTPTAPIPEPATLLLLSSGLAAIRLKARRRKQ